MKTFTHKDRTAENFLKFWQQHERYHNPEFSDVNTLDWQTFYPKTRAGTWLIDLYVHLSSFLLVYSAFGCFFVLPFCHTQIHLSNSLSLSLFLFFLSFSLLFYFIILARPSQKDNRLAHPTEESDYIMILSISHPSSTHQQQPPNISICSYTHVILFIYVLIYLIFNVQQLFISLFERRARKHIYNVHLSCSLPNR